MAAEPEPSWTQLAACSRTALERLSTVRATVDICEPAAGFAGPAVERSVVVSWAAPGLWRLDDAGGLQVLHDGRRHIERDGSGAHERHPYSIGWRPDDLLQLGWGHPDLFVEPAAFATPLRGPHPTQVGRRPAWTVALAAPGNKPYPLMVSIDDATGLVLDHAAEGTPYRCTVTDLVVDAPLPPETFSWDGPATRHVPADAATRAT